MARYQESRRARPDEVRHEHDAGDYFGSILASPPFAAALTNFTSLARARSATDGSYSQVDCELAVQVLCADWATTCVQRMHIPSALLVGVRRQAIEALRARREDDLTEDEREVVRYVRAVANGAVTDARFDAMVDRLGRRGAVEYTIFVCLLIVTIRLQQAFGMPEVSDDEIEALLQRR